MILETLQKRQIDALKSHDTFKLEVIRYLISLIKNKEIELRPQGKVLDDEVVLKLLQKQAKKRAEEIEVFKTGNRADLAEKTAKELAVINEYLTEFAHD